MAREHGRVLVRIWRDGEFRARTPGAQRAYLLVLTQRDVNYAGVLPLAVARWARASEHTSAEDVEVAVKELEDHRFLVIDRDTDEVLVRSFIRNDGLIAQPKMLRIAIREALATESDVLRRALGEELRRVELPEGKRGYDEVAHVLRGAVDTLAPRVASPVDEPVDEPLSAGVPRPSQTIATDPSGVGDGVGDGESWAVGGPVGGKPLAAPSPEPTSSTTTNRPGHDVQPCGRRHDPERACRGCGAAVTNAEDAATRAAAAERQAEIERRDRCRACDVNGWLEHPESGRPVARCDHETDPRQQLADALDHAS